MTIYFIYCAFVSKIIQFFSQNFPTIKTYTTSHSTYECYTQQSHAKLQCKQQQSDLFLPEANRSSNSFNFLIVNPPEAVPYMLCSTWVKTNNISLFTSSQHNRILKQTRRRRALTSTTTRAKFSIVSLVTAPPLCQLMSRRTSGE